MNTATSPFVSGVPTVPPSMQQPQAPPPAASPPPPGPPAVAEGITGHVIGKFNDKPLCRRHFPGPAELARLSFQAQSGLPVAFVGHGGEYHPLSCMCLQPGEPPWKLGDQVARLSRACLMAKHDECLDRSCQCDCGPHESRIAASAAADNQLAAALREISATFAQQQPDKGHDDLLDLVQELQAKVRALEGAAEPDSGTRTCTATTRSGDPCKGTPGEDGLCAAHKAKGDGDAPPVDPDSPAPQEGGENPAGS